MAFGFESTTTEVLQGIDLAGKTVVITGASTGIGEETARALAGANAKVVFAGRNAAKHREAMAKISAGQPGADLAHVELDLTSLTSARHAASTIAETHPEVDVIINNAGVMFTPLDRTTEGFEWQFGINHLAHFVFTNELLAGLAKPPSRIVNLSSGGHQSSDIHWDDPNYVSRPYDKFEAYGQAKTANILFSVELDRRLSPVGSHSYAVHPGMIKTELSRYMSRDDLVALGEKIKASAAKTAAKSDSGTSRGTYKTIEQGAATSVWAATSPELLEQGGTYLADCAVSDEYAPWARDPQGARRLWALSEELVGQTYPDRNAAS